MLDEWATGMCFLSLRALWVYFGLLMDLKRKQKEEKCAAIVIL